MKDENHTKTGRKVCKKPVQLPLIGAESITRLKVGTDHLQTRRRPPHLFSQTCAHTTRQPV